MEVKASSFLGTNNTELFTKKLCCIILHKAGRKDKSLNISRNQSNQKALSRHKQTKPARRAALLMIPRTLNQKKCQTRTPEIPNKAEKAAYYTIPEMLNKAFQVTTKLLFSPSKDP